MTFYNRFFPCLFVVIVTCSAMLSLNHLLFPCFSLLACWTSMTLTLNHLPSYSISTPIFLCAGHKVRHHSAITSKSTSCHDGESRAQALGIVTVLAPVSTSTHRGIPKSSPGLPLPSSHLPINVRPVLMSISGLIPVLSNRWQQRSKGFPPFSLTPRRILDHTGRHDEALFPGVKQPIGSGIS